MKTFPNIFSTVLPLKYVFQARCIQNISNSKKRRFRDRRLQILRATHASRELNGFLSRYSSYGPPTNGNDPVKSHLGKQELFQYFQQNDIKYHNVDHPEVFTVEAMMPYLKDVEGAICKNLFLKDKKKNFYLLSARHDKEVKLNDVAKAIGAKELRFADENVMFDMLGVRQGCVTAYALVNDTQKLAKFIVDKTLLDQSKSKSVNFHPLVNTATTGISCQDFKKFLSLTGHVVLEI